MGQGDPYIFITLVIVGYLMPHTGYVYSFNLYPTIFSCMFAIEYGYNLVNKKKKN